MKQKRTLPMAKMLPVIATWMIVFPVAASTEDPSTDELVAKCAANYDKLQSWIIKSTQSIELRSGSHEVKYTHVYDIRFDGNRVTVRWCDWRNLHPTPNGIAKEKPTVYKSLSWYGDEYVNYGRGADGNDPGSAVIEKSPGDWEIEMLRYENPCSYLTGFCSLGTHERIDGVLGKANAISVRGDRETINGVQCYIVEAETNSGDYTVWIDPVHGYSIAQVYLRMTSARGHQMHGKPMQVKEAVFTFHVARFGEIGGTWLPMESDWTWTKVSDHGERDYRKRHIEVNDAILNPDHDGLRSFLPDDIRNGADVWLPPVIQIRYSWQDRELVTKVDDDLVAAVDETLDRLLLREHGRRSSGGTDGSGQTERAEYTGQRAHRPHCGLYCLYSVLRLGGQKLDYRQLVKPEYYGLHDGSTLAELRRCAIDYGLHAEVVSRLSTRALRDCPYMAILHVKPHAEAKEYNHYELFLGTEDGKARMFNPPDPVRLVSFAELAARWDGAGLLLSAYSLNVDKVLTADRQRLLLCGVIAVLALVALHVGRVIWCSVMGTASRRWAIGLTLGQGAGVGLGALVFGVTYHLANDEALLANTAATAPVQKAYAGAFIPRISTNQARRLLRTDTVFIDARMVSDYKRGHLDRAISLPVDANDALWKERVASIPKGTRIVVYCQSAGCKFAENVSLRLMKEGFKDISIYRGGWNQWVAKNGDAINEAKVKGNDPNGGHVWILKRDPISKS